MLRVKIVPTRPAARAATISPYGQHSPAMPVGATISGVSIRCPSTVVD